MAIDPNAGSGSPDLSQYYRSAQRAFGSRPNRPLTTAQASELRSAGWTQTTNPNAPPRYRYPIWISPAGQQTTNAGARRAVRALRRGGGVVGGGGGSIADRPPGASTSPGWLAGIWGALLHSPKIRRGVRWGKYARRAKGLLRVPIKLPPALGVLTGPIGIAVEVAAGYAVAAPWINSGLYDYLNPKQRDRAQREAQAQRDYDAARQRSADVRTQRSSWGYMPELPPAEYYEQYRIPEPDQSTAPWLFRLPGGVTISVPRPPELMSPGVLKMPWYVSGTSGGYPVPSPARVPRVTTGGRVSAAVRKAPYLPQVAAGAAIAALTFKKKGNKPQNVFGPAQGDGLGLTYAQSGIGYSTGTSTCACPRTRRKSGKKRCSNPRIRSRKYARGGRRYQTITRELKCRA